jgi:large subunit ribosomal protein L13
MKTYSQKAAEIKREWWVIDASTLPLGKLAVVIADKLMGKSKVTYTPHIDNGDYVVVVNAKNLKVTGDKMTKKKYYRHSGFPGGLTELKLEEVIEKNPSLAISEAVKGMLPKNKLSADRLARLRVFDGAEHTHTAQNPQNILKEIK